MFFFGQAGNIIRMTNPAHDVVVVSGRQSQTSTDQKPRLLLQLPLVSGPGRIQMHVNIEENKLRVKIVSLLAQTR